MHTYKAQEKKVIKITNVRDKVSIGHKSGKPPAKHFLADSTKITVDSTKITMDMDRW